MARGRIIISEITKDKRISDLSDDTSRLAFTWLVTFADREGRTHGDPALVRSALFPRREDITIEQMARYIGEWADAGLVVWYECGGDKWIQFPAFDKHQKGFDQRHEPDSVHPPPPGHPDNVQGGCTEVVRTKPVQSTAEMKRKEVNRKEKNMATVPVAVQAYREIANRFPDKATWPDIEATVGGLESDVAFWKEVVTTWIGCGWNKLNVTGMMECYKRREVPGKGVNRATHQSRPGGTTGRAYRTIRDSDFIDQEPSEAG